MHYSRRIIGHHGCDEDTARALLDGGAFKQSTNTYDWLGHGVYFWENGPKRALTFAAQRKQDPAVVSCLIQLGNCLDLLDVGYTEELKLFYEVFADTSKRLGQSLPLNSDRGAHNLDCAVINAYCRYYERKTNRGIDTVRGMFIEGEPVYPESKLMTQSHIQIAVRNPECILGIFKMR